jgi:hypothetical protein
MGHQFLIPHQALLFCIADTQFVMAGKLGGDEADQPFGRTPASPSK